VGLQVALRYPHASHCQLIARVTQPSLRIELSRTCVVCFLQTPTVCAARGTPGRGKGGESGGRGGGGKGGGGKCGAAGGGTQGCGDMRGHTCAGRCCCRCRGCSGRHKHYPHISEAGIFDAFSERTAAALPGHINAAFFTNALVCLTGHFCTISTALISVHLHYAVRVTSTGPGIC
jgi:hypothetical protein